MKTTPTATPAGTPRVDRTNDTTTLRANVTPAQGTPRHGSMDRTCPECGATESWGSASWCPKCGYYPKLGTKVSAEMLHPAESGDAETSAPASLPKWFLVLSAGVVVIIIMSVIARLRVPADGARTIWSLSQLGLGLALLIASHVQAFLLSGSRANNLTMLDLLLSPTAVWKPILQRLPETGMLISRGTWAASIMLCAVLVTGCLGWENLNQLFAPQSNGDQLSPFQKAMLLAGTKKDKKDDAANSDDVIEDLTQEVAAQPAGPEPAMKSQCAIVGFTLDIKGNLHSVLLATMVGGKPAEFVAKLPVEEVAPDIRAKLEARLPALTSRRAYVRCPVQAHWVKPDLTCMIGYDPGEDARKWKNLEFLEIVDPSKSEPEAGSTLPSTGTDAKPAQSAPANG